MELEFETLGKIYKVSIEEKEGSYIVNLGNEKMEVDSCCFSSNILSLSINNRIHRVYIASLHNQRFLFIDGREIFLKPPERREERGVKEEKGVLGLVKSPMPGLVTKVLVKEGEEVEANQGLVVMESMKMENTIRSPAPSRVKRVYVEEGGNIGALASLIELEPL